MKKRLLISSVLMSAVLACALGTGTYAWYEATAGSIGYGTTTAANISTSEGQYVLGSETVALSFGAVSNPTELSDGNGETYYVDGAYKYLKMAETDGVLAAQLGSVPVSAVWGGSNTDAQKALAGEQITARVTASEQIRLLKDGTSVKDANKVTYIDIVITVENDGTLSVSKETVYFAVSPKSTGVQAEEGAVTGTISAAEAPEAE